MYYGRENTKVSINIHMHITCDYNVLVLLMTPIVQHGGLKARMTNRQLWAEINKSYNDTGIHFRNTLNL